MPRVFISYSRADAAWAAKLSDSLQGLGFETFFDRSSIRAGSNWEGEILQALLQCDHLVVLWSRQAQASDWVSRERGRFEAAWQRPNQPMPAGHTLVHLLLDNPHTAFDSYQHVSEILEAGAYAGGAATVSDALWRQVIDRLNLALRQVSLPVTRAIVTVTRRELESGEVDFSFRPPAGRSLDTLLRELAITREQLADYYGATREDWRPFGGAYTIHAVLEGIRDQLNRAPGATPIRWAPVEDELFADREELIEQAAVKLANTVSLIVIDPVALYSHTIRQLVNDYVAKCFDNSHAVVAALPLFPAPPQPRTHQDMVRQVFRSLVDRFYGELPGPARLQQAQCSVFTPDDKDIKRLVRATIRQYATGDEEPANPFLGMRRR
ncbi:MAG TPA: TIR domain-containing protein [Bryobacteraceae bacterium]|nr:TIR domain-containing protein [Bryobacteraceae bacterium]